MESINSPMKHIILSPTSWNRGFPRRSRLLFFEYGTAATTSTVLALRPVGHTSPLDFGKTIIGIMCRFPGGELSPGYGVIEGLLILEDTVGTVGAVEGAPLVSLELLKNVAKGGFFSSIEYNILTPNCLFVMARACCQDLNKRFTRWSDCKLKSQVKNRD